MLLYQQLLYNVLINVTPLVLYHLFRPQIMKVKGLYSSNCSFASPRVVAGLCALAAVLCMLCPVICSPGGVIYDFRMIPLMISVLYGGWLSGAFVAIVISVFRLFIGGIGAVTTPFIMTSVIVVYAFAFRNIRSNPERTTRTAYVLGFFSGLIGAVLNSLYLLLNDAFTWNMAIYACLYTVFHTLTSGLSVHVIEQIKRNIVQQETIQRLDKLNALGDMAASFAHEIRNPLAVAKGFVQMLTQAGLSDDKRLSFANYAMEELDHAQEVVRDYMAFARPHLEKLEQLDAAAVIREAADSVRPFAELYRVDIELRLEDKLSVYGNKEKLGQCITNVCKNGIEAMSGGGSLLIVAAVHNHNINIDIIDHGVGMTEDEIERLGTPFYSTKQKGTGIGTMIAYRVVQSLNGTIDVTSEPGKGTCFSITIPSAAGSSLH